MGFSTLQLEVQLTAKLRQLPACHEDFPLSANSCITAMTSCSSERAKLKYSRVMRFCSHLHV